MPGAGFGAIMACIALVSCGAEHRDWSGPLAAVADSVARGIELTCHREKFQGQYGEFRFAQPPFYFCQGMKADTFLSIALGKDDRAVWVERLWQAPNQQHTSYETLVRALSAHLGEGDMCPQSDDLAVRDNVRWAGPGYNLGVAKVDTAGVGWDYLLGPIDCHRV